MKKAGGGIGIVRPNILVYTKRQKASHADRKHETTNYVESIYIDSTHQFVKRKSPKLELDPLYPYSCNGYSGLGRSFLGEIIGSKSESLFTITSYYSHILEHIM